MLCPKPIPQNDADPFPKPIGRHRAADSPERRKKYIEASLIYFCTELPLSRIRLLYGISERTLQRWVRQALTYEEAEPVRVLAQSFRRRIKLPKTRENP